LIWGWSSTKKWEFVLGLEGGHSKRRILHAGGDATGKVITSFMLQKVKEQPSVKSFENVAAIKLLKQKNCILDYTLMILFHRQKCHF
jgi:L-aspartate oxidase